MFDRLISTLTDISWELIVVDDNSPDGTAELAYSLSAKDTRIRCIKRFGRRGLSSACIEGMLSASATYLAVIDADLQHDESLLPDMLTALKSGHTELVVASRYLINANNHALSRNRQILSRLGGVLARRVTHIKLTDPMSGFFMITRTLFHETAADLSGRGFKVLLDIVTASPRPVQLLELPFEIRVRKFGSSKLDTNVAYEYLLLLIDKLIGRYVPIEFILFIIVVGLSAIFHLGILGAFYLSGSTTFLMAQLIATVTATLLTYALKNIFTHRDNRLIGVNYCFGLLKFITACLIGAAVNLSIAVQLFSSGLSWWLSGLLGMVISAVWNYAVTRVVVWRKIK
jgi:dolichol-phosphate mannosyltransferase